MYQPLALLTGVILAVMVAINGNLTAEYGTFPAAAIIHAVGTLFALVLCSMQKNKKPLLGHHPLWIYLGGAIGVLTTVFNNLAYGTITMTSIVALGLLGQTVTALLIDSLGLFGMQRRPFRKTSLWGFAFAVVGIFVMVDSTEMAEIVAVIVSLVAGVSVVLSRTVNARLAEKVGALRGSLVNHMVGLPITILLAFVALIGNGLSEVTDRAFSPWVYCGGMLGVGVVLLFNLIVLKVPAFRLTVLTFIGQVFTGILLDVITGGGYSKSSFYGGFIVTAGVAVNIIAERLAKRNERREREYWDRIKKVEELHRSDLLKKYGNEHWK